ncbi:hypothetical protein [Escherichia coli]|uniref:hypothetical protein n=1 Tax=Escherichia coli TaxID=562 RepID=UPI002083BA70|nr:hypothetical protein [Escherichia coli]GIZ56480.1 hypothetical protein ECTHUN287_23290 [Escherichia coli]
MQRKTSSFLGYGRHYDTAHYILYMTAVMLFWPVTLPAATDIVADRLKKGDDDAETTPDTAYPYCP